MARICVVRQQAFPQCVRVKRQVEALCRTGHEVDLICQREPGQPLYERSGQVSIHRLPFQHSRPGRGGYLVQYIGFMTAAGLLLAALQIRRRYDLVQINSVPDTLVFSAIVPKLLGVPVVLDLHECMPELFATKFKVPLDNRAVKVLARFEQSSIRFSDFAITVNSLTRDLFVARGAPAEKFAIVHNSSDDTIFDHRRYPRRGRDSDEFVLMSHGTIEDYYGLDTIIRAVSLLRDEIPGLRFKVYGTGGHLPELTKLSRSLGVESHVHFNSAMLPVEQMPQLIADADVGVVAIKRTPHGEIMQTNKMYDFIAMRRPILISRTEAVERYFGAAKCFETFTPDDEHDAARAILRLYREPEHARRLAHDAVVASQPYHWASQREQYLDVVDRLLNQRGSGGQTRSNLAAG